MIVLHACFSLSQFCLFFYFSWIDAHPLSNHQWFSDLRMNKMKNQPMQTFFFLFRLFRLKTLLPDEPLLQRRDRTEPPRRCWCPPTGCRSCGRPGSSSSPSSPPSYRRGLRAPPTDGTAEDTLAELLHNKNTKTWEKRERTTGETSLSFMMQISPFG